MHTTLEIVPLTPALRKLDPESVLSTGGEMVKVHLSGFPVFTASSQLLVTLRGAPVAAKLLYSDALWAGFSFLSPAGSSGVATLLVQHANFSSVSASAELLVTSDP